MDIHCKSIGIIHSPHRQAAGTPIQPLYATGIPGTVEVFPEYAEGLKDIEGFDRIWVVYWFDRAPSASMHVKPFRDKQERGLFATRAPARPNPIGLSCVKLLQIRGNLLDVSDVDILDGTPLLDIKPYVEKFDHFPNCRSGWLDSTGTDRTHADDRFADGKAQKKLEL